MEDTMTRRDRLPRLQREMAGLILAGEITYRPEDGEYLDVHNRPIGGTGGRALRSMARQDMLSRGEDITPQTYRVGLSDETRARVEADHAR